MASLWHRRNFRACLVCVAIGFAVLLIFDLQSDSVVSKTAVGSQLMHPFHHIAAAVKKAADTIKFDDNEMFVQVQEQKTDMKVDGTILTINAPKKSFKSKKIKVHVVLHSHVDPGWLETFEEYYVSKVQHILNYAVEWLTKVPKLRFIWSEMSFLERWWQNATDLQKSQMKKLISSGQFELCGGAWVMTDEATPHYTATIDNMIEGHRFVWETFQVRPNTSWSVDPFGHGLMIPGLLPVSGVGSMVIGRINDHQKQKMRAERQMRFHWKQPYRAESRPELKSSFVYVLPYMYYTTRSSCGPNDTVCCKYHVGPSALWCTGTLHEVTDVKAHAEELLAQYRITASHYNSEKVLVAVGDDFYLTKSDDWKEVAQLYTAIADYVDKTPSLNAKIQFSTVSDYFNDIANEQSELPSLTGDFFPYTQDENNPQRWWTGYFSHRPFFKRMSRIVEWKLRTFDLLNVLSGGGTTHSALTKARRDLALFQHHDAITGTSKRHVMEDYLERLVASHKILSREASEALALLTDRPPNSVQPLDPSPTYTCCTPSFGGNWVPPKETEKKKAPCEPTKLPELRLLQVPHGRTVTILAFNPVLGVNEHVVRLLINRVDVTVLDKEGNKIVAQINPVFLPGTLKKVKDKYELVFIASIEPLSSAEFVLKGEADKEKVTQAATKEFDNIAIRAVDEKPPSSSPNHIYYSAKNEKVELKMFNGGFDNLMLDGEALNTQIEMQIQSDRGGAYVLEAVPPVMSINRAKAGVLISGPVEDKLVTSHSNSIIQTVSIIKTSAAHLASAIDITVRPVELMDQVLFFDVATDLFTDGIFSTDENGMYMMRRVFNEKKDFDANVFPAATSAFIEDKMHRISMHLGQPAGVVGKKDGTMKIVIDRRGNADDGKGLPYGEDFDEHQPEIRMRMFVEKRNPSGETVSSSHSLPSQKALDTLRHPIALFVVKQSVDGDYVDVHAPAPPEPTSKDIESDPALENPMARNLPAPPSLFEVWPCNLELVSLRYIRDNQILAIVRRITFDKTIVQSTKGCTTDLSLAFDSLAALAKPGTFKHTSLAGTKIGDEATPESFYKALQAPFAIAPFVFTATQG